MLGHRGLKTRVQQRVGRTEKAVGRRPCVVESHVQVGAPLKCLLIGKVHCARVLRQTGTRQHALENAGSLLTEVVLLKSAGEDRVEAIQDRAKAESRSYEAASADAGA